MPASLLLRSLGYAGVWTAVFALGWSQPGGTFAMEREKLDESQVSPAPCQSNPAGNPNSRTSEEVLQVDGETYRIMRDSHEGMRLTVTKDDQEIGTGRLRSGFGPSAMVLDLPCSKSRKRH